MTAPTPHQPASTPLTRFTTRVLDNVARVLVGKEDVTRLALAGILAGGHVLLEDAPGTGKTMLARALAASLGLDFRRVQFTPDLLPGDVTGLSVYRPATATFEFVPGPIFTGVLLADEINRATPKTQSALLEAMGEGQVTESGVTHRLAQPFVVIATQNPVEHEGTYRLPEAQLDRFLLTVTLGYPDVRAERELLETGGRSGQIRTLNPVLDAPALLGMQREVDAVHAAAPLLDYLQLLARASREHPAIAAGLSPRALLALLAAARAWAFLGGRQMVLPEDVQAVFPSLAAHRLPPRDPGADVRTVMAALLRDTPIP